MWTNERQTARPDIKTDTIWWMPCGCVATCPLRGRKSSWRGPVDRPGAPACATHELPIQPRATQTAWERAVVIWSRDARVKGILSLRILSFFPLLVPNSDIITVALSNRCDSLLDLKCGKCGRLKSSVHIFVQHTYTEKSHFCFQQKMLPDLSTSRQPWIFRWLQRCRFRWFLLVVHAGNWSIPAPPQRSVPSRFMYQQVYAHASSHGWGADCNGRDDDWRMQSLEERSSRASCFIRNSRCPPFCVTWSSRTWQIAQHATAATHCVHGETIETSVTRFPFEFYGSFYRELLKTDNTGKCIDVLVKQQSGRS